MLSLINFLLPNTHTSLISLLLLINTSLITLSTELVLLSKTKELLLVAKGNDTSASKKSNPDAI